MPAWYDIEGFGIDRKLRKYAGIEDSVARIRALIKAEVDAGIPSGRIALAGFSQGGAMSLYTGLTHPETLGGIIGISGHLPLQEKVAPAAAALAPPVFQGHGDKVGLQGTHARAALLPQVTPHADAPPRSCLPARPPVWLPACCRTASCASTGRRRTTAAWRSWA